MTDSPIVQLSALQHYVFCPRQCSLIHNEQLWAENYLTAQGRLLHETVDKGLPESRKGLRFERAVQVHAPRLGLIGKLDLLEIHHNPRQYVPVEYKRGRPKQDLSDLVQLCAQAFCLEEMLEVDVKQGAVWYWQTRKRLPVEIDADLRQQTRAVIGKVKDLLAYGVTPKAKFEKKCKACSLYEYCNPKLLSMDRSRGYVQDLFNPESAE